MLVIVRTRHKSVHEQTVENMYVCGNKSAIVTVVIMHTLSTAVTVHEKLIHEVELEYNSVLRRTIVVVAQFLL